MKHRAKCCLRIAGFLAVLCITLAGCQRLLVRKESEKRIRPFLETAEEYDVLFFGDSQVLYGIYPLELYGGYGIASYNLGSANSTMA